METKSSSKVIRSFIKRFSIVALLILGFSSWVVLTQRSQYLDIVETHEIDLVKSNILTFNTWLENRVEYTSILSGMIGDELERAGKTSSKYDRIADVFSLFGSRFTGCVQLRYLSPQGRELVRINISTGTRKEWRSAIFRIRVAGIILKKHKKLAMMSLFQASI